MKSMLLPAIYIAPIRNTIPALPPRKMYPARFVSTTHQAVCFSGGSYDPNDRRSGGSVDRERIERHEISTGKRDIWGRPIVKSTEKPQKSTTHRLPRIPQISELTEEIKSQIQRDRAGEPGIQGTLFAFMTTLITSLLSIF